MLAQPRPRPVHLDEDGAGVRVLDVLHEGVLLLPQHMLVHQARIPQGLRHLRAPVSGFKFQSLDALCARPAYPRAFGNHTAAGVGATTSSMKVAMDLHHASLHVCWFNPALLASPARHAAVILNGNSVNCIWAAH